MSARLARRSVAVALVALVAGLGTERARPAAPPVRPGVRLDSHGDPLPLGALARLGSIHLRHSGLTRVVGWCAGGKVLISTGLDGIRFWDAKTGRSLRHIAEQVIKPAMLTKDGKLLVFMARGC